MNILIVEDEQRATNLIKNILTKSELSIEVIGEAKSIKTALKLINDLKPDLLLLDIELPDGTAFDLLNELGDFDQKIIFITAFEKYALKAIKMSALDYIMKPIDPDELVEAVERAVSEKDKYDDQKRLKYLLSNQKEKSQFSQIILKDKNGFQLVEIKRIIRLEAMGSYTRFNIENSDPIIISKNLKEYDSILRPYGFFRCHKSHLINLNFIKSYSRYDGEILILQDDSEVPLALRKKESLMRVLEQRAHIK